MVRFLLNDELISLGDAQADLTVLQYLREHRALTGTKEGCASGDCGACTVVLAELSDTHDAIQYRAINSCVTFMSALEGKQLLTVEHLGNPSNPHPVQQAMVEHHGSQCGFCTPGFVMSLFALYQNQQQNSQAINREDVIHCLSGNLCRCTGYRPIIDAALDVCNQPAQATEFDKDKALIARLTDLQSDELAGHSALRIPKNRQQLGEALSAWPDATLVAGSTDIALQVTQQLKPLPKIISLTHVDELHRIEDSIDKLVIGAACSLKAIQTPLLNAYPQLEELLDRFASVPIRNQATLGGNVANASPIGDLPPVLLALDASVVIDNGDTKREVAIRDFFVDYRKTVLKQGEWLDSIVIPKPVRKSNNVKTTMRAYKVSKRIEDDISAVCAVFALELDNNQVTGLRTGFGGVAATPAFCDDLEKAVIGKSWDDQACIELGKSLLTKAFSPIDDVRASAEYRQQILGNLWQRFWLETQHTSNLVETRVVSHA